MKKLSVLFAFMLCAGVSFADTFTPKIGYDAVSQLRYEQGQMSETYDTGAGIAVGADYLHPINGLIAVGLGFECQLPREVVIPKGDLDPLFNFIPVYVTAVITPFKGVNGFTPYGKLSYGYSFMTGNDDLSTHDYSFGGGFCWAVGVGASYGKFFGELLYATNTGHLILEQDTFTAIYAKCSLTVGYRFDLK